MAVITCLVVSTLVGQPEREREVRLLAFGDVNLGRVVGQHLLRGELAYPFQHVLGRMSQAEIVFVNLESQLTEQRGETQHPRYNLIFCGPPSGAEALNRGGVSVVSTANNHAYDYGMRALTETLAYLDSANVAHTGTSRDSLAASNPAIVETGGVRIGFLAYTQFVNLKGPWKDRISVFHDAEASADVERLRPQVDFLIVSYHGGEEYSDRPSAATRRRFRILVEAGADVVVGHHPHYAQGIEWYNGALLLYSLGNFVFYQPQREWARYGLGVELTLRMEDRSSKIGRVKLLPLVAGLQPSFSLSAGEKRSFFKRLTELSAARLTDAEDVWYVQNNQEHE